VLRKLALLQGVFYVVTGLWPLIHMTSFLQVTGPKTDLWLVRTVAVLVTVIGAVILQAGRRRRVTPEVVLLASGSALGLAAIDIVHVLSKVISPIYLADAAVELGLVASWALAWRRADG